MNLIEAIIAVPDHRHKRGIRHHIWLILTIILLGSCTGYWRYKPLVEFTKNHRATLIMVSVYSHARGWVVRHKVMENQQQSEIEAVEELIRGLSGSQVVVTADGLHCQKKHLP